MKKYKVEFTLKAAKQFKKLDRYTQRIITGWIDKNLVDCSNPRAHGKALKGNLQGLWRYRVADYRIVVQILDDMVLIQVMEVGHRKEIYE